ncbi:MAG: ATP-binding cassette domain-containing protein, partial [Candidatus Omnitrophica bacterium]|nr:ATP-binding cassette domain-containing protein [Candidatus Omnitrophota bacterium]
SLGVSLLFAVPFILLGKYSYRLGVLNTTTSNHTKSVIQENISLAKIVLGFGKQQKSVDSLANAFDAHRDATLKSQFLSIAIPILYDPFGVVMIVIALFTARRFNVPLSELMVLLLALRQVAFSVGNLTAQKNSLENFFPSYEQIENLRNRAKRLKQKSGEKCFNGIEREISLQNVSFSYPGHGEVLSAVSVRVPKGKMIAFVGGSGAGKSTLIDVILGFHSPSDGRVLCDGVSLAEFEINSFRRKVGYVPQDSALFNMTIKDNLLWALETAQEKDIISACCQANADEFIRQLPEGYNTFVGDRGVRLSGGQVQRIALARSILRKPELLILDEATSALDTHSEKLIQQAIETIAKKTTVIVIAHRLSTIVNADYVYVLEKGRIVEEGTYRWLMENNGYFNRMVAMQTL